MTSKNRDASKCELLNLIYHHLKESGHKKAASELKKHLTQVATVALLHGLHETNRFGAWLQK